MAAGGLAIAKKLPAMLARPDGLLKLSTSTT
jgi:hypothetical protein